MPMSERTQHDPEPRQRPGMLTSALHRRGSHAGVTLVEVLVTLSISAIVLSALSVWVYSTFRAQEVARTQTAVARIVTKLNTSFATDVSGAQFAVASTDENGDPRTDWYDCVGGDGAATSPDQIVLVLVSPGDRRIVYTLVDDPGGVDKALYRRDCPNLKSLGAANTTDPSLSDPVEPLLNGPKGADLADPTKSTKVVAGIRDATLSKATSTCPPDQQSKEVGETYDVNCKTVKLAVSIGGRSEPLVFESTRRTDTYCAPNCRPTAAFQVSNTAPNKGSTVTFDARTSTDRRGDYYPPGQTEDVYALAPESRLHYHWDFDARNCDPSWTVDPSVTGNAWPPETDPPETALDARHLTTNGQVMPSVAFNKACNFEVTLTVTNNSGRSSSFTRYIDVQGERPLAQITNSPLPIRIVRNRSVNFASLITTFEGDLDPNRSSWNWGDGTPTVDLTPASSNNNTTCTTPTLCTASNDLISHRYTKPGVYTAVLTVTDSSNINLTSTSIATVIVKSEYYYVSDDPILAHDSTDCGPIIPDYKPCRTIGWALLRAGSGSAEDQGKTDILVGSGTYPSFEAVNGINVSGGRDDTGGASATWAYDAANPSIVEGVEVEGPPDRHSIGVANITLPTTLADLTVRPGNAVDSAATVEGVVVDNSTGVVLSRLTVENGNGRNPTGVLVTNGSTVTVKDSTVRSGTPVQSTADAANRSAYGIRALRGSNVSVQGGRIEAAAGLPGVSGESGINEAAIACKGNDGAAETQANGGTCTGPGGTTSGSYGGGGGCPGDYRPFNGWDIPGCDGADGQFANAATAPYSGAGGAGGWAATPFPRAGKPGAGGAGAAAAGRGTGGAAGSNTADLADELWQSAAGAAGTAAAGSATGSPGGGGGGGGGTCIFNGFTCPGVVGAQGGGGGGGGRPNLSPGAGGYAGGGSFGVYAHDSTLNVGGGATVIASAGGNGGAGGDGGDGGAGGAGGKGRAQSEAGDSSSGGGGGGGAGAGGGGGGAGGPSVAVFSVGNGPVPGVTGAVLTPTAGAADGLGGAGGAGGTGGAGGPDPQSTVSGDRAGKPGQAGSVGASGLDGAKGESGMVCGLFSIASNSNGCFSSSVLSITRAGPSDLTNAGGPGGTLAWTVTFDGAVDIVDDDDTVTSSNFSTVGEGIENLGSLPIVVTGTGATRTVTVSGIRTATAATGKISLVMKNVTGITQGGQQIADPRPKPFPGEQYRVDQQAPTVTSIERVTDALTNNGAVSWYVTFSEPVTGLEGSNFTFTVNGVQSPAVAQPPALLQGSTVTWEVTVNTGTKDGTLALNLSQFPQLVKDAAGNSLTGLPYVGDAYTIDKTPPKLVSILRHDPTSMWTNRGLASNPGDVTWRVTFDEPVVGVYVSGPYANFGLDPSVTGAALTTMTQVDGATYDVSASTGTGDGDLLLNLAAAQQIKDPAGNAFDPQPGAPWSGPPAVDGTHEKYVIDKTRPTATITRSDPATPATNAANATPAGTVRFLAHFDEPVTGITSTGADFFSLDEDLSGTPTVGAVTPQGSTGQDYVIDVNLSPTSGSGMLRLDLTSTGAAAINDRAGNPASATVGQESYLVDRVKPTASAAKAPTAEWTKLTSAPVMVTFTSSDALDNGVNSDVAAVHYTTSAGASSTPADPRDVANPSTTANGSFPVSTPGVTRISYSARDGAGNWSDPQIIEVKLDGVLPTTTLTITGAAGSDESENKYVGFAKLQFNPTDPLGDPEQRSGVAATYYTLDGSDPTLVGNVNRKVYDPLLPPVIRKDTPAGTVMFASIDVAGNVEAPVQSVSFKIFTHGPKFNSGIVATTCVTEAQGHMATGTLIQDYIDSGCIRLSVDVSEYDPLLGVDHITYFRCEGNVNPCVIPADNGPAVEIGTVTGTSPYQLDTRRLFSASWLPGDWGLERDYTIVAVAYDNDGTRSSSDPRSFAIDVTPPTAPAPTVDGKS